LYADTELDLETVAQAMCKDGALGSYASQPPLFANMEEYEAFHARHMRASVPRVAFGEDVGPVHIGIDSGSTTVKMAVIDQQDNLLFTNYQPNSGNPIPLLRQLLMDLYRRHPGLNIASVTTTGYGEALAKSAFEADFGIV